MGGGSGQAGVGQGPAALSVLSPGGMRMLVLLCLGPAASPPHCCIAAMYGAIACMCGFAMFQFARVRLRLLWCYSTLSMGSCSRTVLREMKMVWRQV